MESKARDRCPTPNEFARKDTGEIIRSPCFNWRCPACGPKRRAELSLRIRRSATVMVKEIGESAQWLTLTLDPKRNRASAANGSKLQAQYVSRCWRKLTCRWRERCRRRGKVRPWYVKVCEWRANTDAMHLHCLVVGWLPGRIRSDIIECGFGHSFQIERVRDIKRLARYLTKYVAKTAGDQAPRYVHRYSASRGAMPTLKLWKRLMQAGALRLLKSDHAVLVTTGDMVTTADVWWSGPKLEHVDDWLTAVGGASEPRPELAFVGRAGPSDDEVNDPPCDRVEGCAPTRRTDSSVS